jgi:hypothetical protein
VKRILKEENKYFREDSAFSLPKEESPQKERNRM